MLPLQVLAIDMGLQRVTRRPICEFVKNRFVAVSSSTTSATRREVEFNYVAWETLRSITRAVGGYILRDRISVIGVNPHRRVPSATTR